MVSKDAKDTKFGGLWMENQLDQKWTILSLGVRENERGEGVIMGGRKSVAEKLIKTLDSLFFFF